MIRLPGAVVLVGKWPKPKMGGPLLAIITPSSQFSFAQTDNRGKIIWFERTWPNAYSVLANLAKP